LKKDDATGQTKKEANVVQQSSTTEPAPVGKSKIMDTVGLSRDMMDKIAKEMAK
jgi:flagellar basal-body rod modification protein FlgD